VLALTTGNFIVLLIPSILVLIFSGFSFEGVFQDEVVSNALIYVLILGVIGTGIAMIIFNRLIQISDPVFSTSVTYTIPLVALGWGLLDGEVFSLLQLISMLVILLGVFLVNRAKNLYTKNKKTGI